MSATYPGGADTLCAVATPPGEGGIGVVRVSGSRSFELLQALFRTPGGKVRSRWEPRRLYLGYVVAEDGEERIDQVLAVFMPGPRSYTGEDVVELHGHGGPIPLRRIMGRLLALGARLPEPGELTMRAFLHGRLELSQAEAVIDLIRARTESAARAAMSQYRGRFAAGVHQLSDELVDWVAALEAQVDFPEDDIPPSQQALELGRAARLRALCDRLLAGADAGRLMQQGARLALVGRPNVGKSSLLNALLGESRAIVTDVPGTTRDSIEEPLQLAGIPIRLVDTAGIRSTSDEVERIGVERSRALLASCDLVVLVLDATAPLTLDDEQLVREAAERPCLVVLNKMDRVDADAVPARVCQQLAQLVGNDLPLVPVSAQRGDGLLDLERAVEGLLLGGLSVADDVLGGNLRHRDILLRARACLEAAQATLEAGLPADFVTIDLKAAILALGEITGATVTEAILDRVFSTFCIGK